MKNKYLFILTILVVMLCVSGCAKSKEAQMADAMIASLGEITLESGDSIIDAEKAVEALTESQYNKLDNVETLMQARIQYDKLCVNNVIDNIDELIKIKDASADRIQIAKDLYNGLNDNLKEKVSNYGKIADYENNIIREKASVVENIIDKIGTVTLESEPAIKEAEREYEALGPKIKEAVQNYNKLETAKKQFKQLQINDIEKAINGIGTVTTKTVSKLSIEKARKIYESYNEDIQNSISNYQILVDAEKKYLDLQREQLENLISEIGEVTLDSESQIQKVRKTFDASDENVKSLVGNLSVLEKAEETIIDLKVNEIISLIDGIGKVSIDSEDELNKIKKKYDALSWNDKKKVSNYDVLSEAITKVSNLKKEALEKQYNTAIGKLRKETDDVTKRVYYFPKNMPKYIDDRTHLAPELHVSDGWVSVWWTLDYVDDDWLFWSSAHIYLNDNPTPYEYISLNYFDVKRDNKYGKIWEYYYVKASSKDIELLRKIADSDKAVIVFYGSQYKDKWIVPEKDKKGIKEVLEVYDLMIKMNKARDLT